MVGKIFRVVFTRYAQRRRQQIFDFEENLNGKHYTRIIYITDIFDTRQDPDEMHL